MGVAGGGERGRRGEPRGAAERRVGVRAVVPEVADGADGGVVHPGARRRPPAPGARLAGAFFKSPELKARVTADMRGRLAAAMDAWRATAATGAGAAVRVQDEAKSVRTWHDTRCYLPSYS